MHPVLFELSLGGWGSFTIGTYGLFYAVGFLLALRLAVFYARRDGIEAGRETLAGAIVIADEAEPPLPLISHRVTTAGAELYRSE